MAALATGILASGLVLFDSGELLISIAALTVLALMGLWRGARGLPAACCLMALIAAGILVSVAHRPGPAPELDTDERAPVLLAGCVLEPSAISVDRDQFVLELAPGARARVSLFVREGEQPPLLRYGQKIEIEARVRHPHDFNNPGGFAYVRYLARQHIYWTASARASTPIRLLPGRCGSSFLRFVYDLRTAALDRLESLYQGNEYDTGMMQAILIGETARLDKVWTEHYRATGTFHALVISGSHVAVLAAFFLFLLRVCFVPSSAALLLTAGAAWLYALVTGWQPPVVRSAAGLTLFVLGRSLYRERRILNLLAAVAIGFLVLDPEEILDASFQLSFLSVGVIAIFAVPWIDATSGPLVKGLSGLWDTGRDLHISPRAAQFRVELRLLCETLELCARLPRALCAPLITWAARLVFFAYEMALVSAAVQIGLALPMIVYFHRVSFSGISANVVVVPLLGAVVPAGFVAVFTGWALPARAAGWLLGLSLRAVDWHARFEPNWRVPAPPLWLGVVFSLAVLAAALCQQRSKRARWTTAIAVLALLALIVRHPFAPRFERGSLEMTAVDVGQGDSIFLAFPDGRLMLMDGGGIPSFGRRSKTKLDIGEDVVSPYLWSRSIRSLDVVALSHAHEDHIAGLGAIIRNFHPRELWTGATPEGPEWAALRDEAHRAGARIVPMLRGRSFDYGGAHVDVLAPSADYVPAVTPKNNDSLVLRVCFRERSFLLSGDIERQVEYGLLDSGVLRRSDVLKVAHHGSKTSSTAAFLDAAHPIFAVISAGPENPYGHPHPEILRRFGERRVPVFRTDEMGLVTIRTDGWRLRVDPWQRENPVSVSVRGHEVADGKKRSSAPPGG